MIGTPWPGLIAHAPDPSSFSPHVVAPAFRAALGSSVMVNVQDGVDVYEGRMAELIDHGWLLATMAVPLRPGVVHFPQLDDPIAEARILASSLRLLDRVAARGSGYVFVNLNCEGAFEARPDAGVAFLDEYRRLLPQRQTLAQATGSIRDLLEHFGRHRIRLSWEAYDGAGRYIDPQRFVHAYTYRPAWTRFTYGAFGEGPPFAHFARDLQELIAGGHPRGLVFYPAASVPVGTWELVGAEVRARQLAIRTAT